MRSYKILLLLIFLAFYILIAIGSYKNLKKILLNKKNHFSTISFWTINTIIFFIFIFLYIYPNHPREPENNYQIYFSFNSILFIDVIFNFFMSLSYLLYLLVGRQKGISPLPYTGLILGTCFSLVMLYGTIVGNRQIKINDVKMEFDNLPKSFDGLKIVQISDIHFGGMNRNGKLLNRVTKKIKKLSPDLLIFTGDLINNFSNELKGFETILQNLGNLSRNFAILGNHDYGDYTNWKRKTDKKKNFDNTLSLIESSGFKLLRNEHDIFVKGSDTIYIAGVENWGYPPFPQYADLNKALKDIPSKSFTILLTHDPVHWQNKIAGKMDIELTLSGHTHGFQWGINFAGFKFSPACIKYKYWGGLYKSEHSQLYVNTGIGTVGVPWRIDMPAEITVITLKRS